jgi:hypothetical protein
VGRTLRGLLGEGPGISWSPGGKGLRETGMLETLGWGTHVWWHCVKAVDEGDAPSKQVTFGLPPEALNLHRVTAWHVFSLCSSAGGLEGRFPGMGLVNSSVLSTVKWRSNEGSVEHDSSLCIFLSSIFS